MKWLNIDIPSLLESAEYRRSGPADRGTWLAVLCFACREEGGGVIKGGASWTDREWIQACGATLKEIRATKLLLHVEGNDVHVFGYPLEAEAQVRENAKNAKLGAAARWAKERATGNADSVPPGMPTGINSAHAESEPPGIESAVRNRKGKEEIEKETPPPTPQGGPGLEAEEAAHDPADHHLLVVVKACGGFLIHPQTHEDLRPQWTIAVQGLAAHHVQEVFTAGPTIPKEGTIRYPDRFVRVRVALRTMGKEAAAKRERAAAQVEEQARKTEDLDRREEIERTAQLPAQRLLAYLRTVDQAVLDRFNALLPASFRTSIATGLQKNRFTSLTVDTLTKYSPELAAVANGRPVEVA